MLKQRIVTAILLIALLLAAFFTLPAAGIALVLGLFVAAGAWEWSALCKWTGAARGGYVVAIVVAGGALVAATLTEPRAAYAVYLVAAAWWIYALFDLARDGEGLLHSATGRAVAGTLIIIPVWVAMTWLHATDPRRPLLVLFVVVLVAIADTGAYAAGHAFGRTKLAPAISPGKTVEGVIGGAMAVLLVAYFCGTMIWQLRDARLGIWVALALVTGLVSVVGDLTESKMKRIAGVKDSGVLLPGHGGVLDRIDALTAAAPAYALGWLLLLQGRT
ncbi:MAG: phosphatidate cytidylyltransferase [Sulfurifustis sp.]